TIFIVQSGDQFEFRLGNFARRQKFSAFVVMCSVLSDHVNDFTARVSFDAVTGSRPKTQITTRKIFHHADQWNATSTRLLDQNAILSRTQVHRQTDNGHADKRVMTDAAFGHFSLGSFESIRTKAAA